MVSTISRLRNLGGLSYRTLLGGNFPSTNCNEKKDCFNKDFLGYAGSNSMGSCNNRHYKSHRTRRLFSSQKNSADLYQGELDPIQFDKISGETLDSLTEYFDELVEQADHLKDADVSYGGGVLTIKFGDEYGTYVINRQSPNKQIWLSSPKSGPKRYDFTVGKWIYKHDGKTMHELLDDEIPTVVKNATKFAECSYGGKEKSHKNSQ